MKEIIYTNRYNLPQTNEKTKNNARNQKSSTELEGLLSIEYQLCVAKEENKDKFISKVIKITEFMEIDVDIFKYDYFIEVLLYLQNGPIMGEFKKQLIDIFSYCDEIVIMPAANTKYDSCIALNYYTHEIKI